MIEVEKRSDGIFWIRLDNELLLKDRREFCQTYEHETSVYNLYVIDFTKTSKLDSSGLGLLLALRAYALSNGSQVQLYNPHDNILSILRTSKFDLMFDIVSA